MTMMFTPTDKHSRWKLPDPESEQTGHLLPSARPTHEIAMPLPLVPAAADGWLCGCGLQAAADSCVQAAGTGSGEERLIQHPPERQQQRESEENCCLPGPLPPDLIFTLTHSYAKRTTATATTTASRPLLMTSDEKAIIIIIIMMNTCTTP